MYSEVELRMKRREDIDMLIWVVEHLLVSLDTTNREETI